MSYLRELMAANIDGWPTDPAEQEKEVQIALQNPQYLIELFRGSVDGFDQLPDGDQAKEINLALRQHERTLLGERQPRLELDQAAQAENARLSDTPLAEGLTPTTALQTAGSLVGSVVKSAPKMAANVALGAPEVVAKALGFQERGEAIEANRRAVNEALDYIIPTPPVAPPFAEQVEAGIPGAIAALPLTGAQAVAPMAAELAATSALAPVAGPIQAGAEIFGGMAIPDTVSRMQDAGGKSQSMVALGATKAMLNGLIFSLPIQSLFGGKEAAKTVSPTLWNFVKEAFKELPKTYAKFAPAGVATAALDKGIDNFVRAKKLTSEMGESIKGALFNLIPTTVGFSGLHAARMMQKVAPTTEKPEAKPEAPVVEIPKEPAPSTPIVPTEIKPAEAPRASDKTTLGGGITRVPESWVDGTMTPNQWARTVENREPTPAERAVTHLRDFPGDPQARSAAFIQAINLMNENPVRLELQRRGTITNEQMKELADKTPLNLQEMLNIKPGTILPPELSVKIWDTAATFLQAHQDAQGEYVQTPSRENFAKVESLKTIAQTLLINAKAVSTEYGRGLQSQKMAARARKLIDDTLNELDNINKTEPDAQKAATIWDKWYELYVNSLLSGIRTQTSNIAGNTGFLFTQPIEKAVATGLDVALTGGKNLRPSQNLGWAYGLFSGIQESARLGLEGMKDIVASDAPVKNFYMRLAESARQPDAQGKFDGGRQGAISGAKGEFIRTPVYFLSAVDNVMKSWIYSASAYEQAYREARNEGKALFSPEFNARVAEIVKNPDAALGAERGAEFRDKAIGEARYLTYTQPLGPFLKNLMKARQTPGVEGFLAKVIFPFVSTTANVGKITLERTPLNFIRLAKRGIYGELKSAEMATELAKPLLGSAIGGAAVMMAAQGMITGFGPKDPGKRKDWLLTRKPYSLSFDGKTWYSYDKLEPLGSIIGMAADLVEMAKAEDDQTYGDYAKNFALSIGSNLANKTFVRQLATLMQAWTDPQRYGQPFVESLAMSMVPAGGMLNTIRQAKDPLVREVSGPQEAIMNRVPGLSELLLERRDVLGRQISLGASAFARAVSPVRVSIDSDDPVDKWINDMNLELSYPAKAIRFGGKQIKFDPVVYDRVLVEGGKKVYDYLNKIRQTADPTTLDPKVKEARAKRIKAVISNLREATARRIVVSLKLHKEQPNEK